MSQKWTNGHISQTITLTDIIPGTKVQHNKQHLMTEAFLTLTSGQGHNSRSKVTDVEVLWMLVVLLHLHGIMEGLYFHCSLSLCVCLCVCPALLVNKISAERMHRFGRSFSLNGCLLHWLEPYWNWWPKMYVKMMKKIRQKFKPRHLLNQISSFDRKFYDRHFDT